MKGNLKQFSLSIWFLGIYLLLSPLDMVLNIFQTGTILRYVGLATILICLLEIIRNNICLHIKIHHTLTLILVFYFLASVLWSVYEPGLINAISVINLAFFYLVVTIRRYTPREYHIERFFCILGALICSLCMIINSGNLMYLDRVTIVFGGAFVDPNDMAANLILPLFLGIQIIQERPTRLKGTIALLSTFIIGFTVLLTGSRGGLSAIIIGLIALLFVAPKLSMTQKVFRLIIIALFCMTFYQVAETYLPVVVKNRLTINKVLEDKASNRFQIWADAAETFGNSGVLRGAFGYGIANFPLLHAIKYGEYAGTHNLFVQNLMEGGICALLLITAILLITIKNTLNEKRNVMFAIIIATIIISCSLETLNKKFFWNALIFASTNWSVSRKMEVRGASNGASRKRDSPGI